jgi:membrane-associated phospholipid phosphatase
MNPSLNQSLFLWLNQACSALPDWLWSSLTITGHTSILFALLAPLLLPRLGRSDVITGLFATALLGGLVSWLLKEWFQVPRPPAVLSADQFHLIGHKLELVSFPSGHTLSAFAVATLLVVGLRLRGWRLAGVGVLAACVGLSRVAVGAHWPFDVLGGAALGAACGVCGWCLSQRLHQQSWTQTVTYRSCQAAILLLVSASLLVTAMGYPDASVWQYAATAIGVISSVLTLILLLKSFKLLSKG